LPTSNETSPAFGTATLTNCEMEQIHLAASIQPHGALLLVSEPDYTIVQASANAAEVLGRAEHPVGQSLRKLGGNLSDRIRPYLKGRIETIPVVVSCHLGDPSRPFNALLHHPPGGGLVVEIEAADTKVDHSAFIRQVIDTAMTSSSLKALCDSTAELFRTLTGYDRVMVYRFDPEGHGEVFSEVKKAELEAFLGNRYPASDIPQIARRLYESNRVRILVDVNYSPVPLVPRQSPISGTDLDMSLCFLRSASPIHVQYLKNMGVRATLVVSLMVGGKLWGLISCHHYSPRFLHFEMRAVCELLAEIVATRIAALESFVNGQGELYVRRLEQRLVESIANKGDWQGALFGSASSILAPLSANGAALLFDGQVKTIGEVPGTEEIREIGKWIASQHPSSLRWTSSLGMELPSLKHLTSVASGVLATRISGEPNEMLIWFRKERIRTITWGGNPFKPVQIGNDPLELSPRRSFSQWHQVVEGTSDAWTTSDQTTARMIGSCVTDVILQIRSVRILIAQDQLDKFLQQVRASEQQVLIANAAGKILEANSALHALLQIGNQRLQSIEELPLYFADSAAVANRLKTLMQKGRPWQGEVLFEGANGETKPLLIRAEPVRSDPDRIIGFVIVFSDLTGRKAMENARKRFQSGILQNSRKLGGQLNTEADLVFQNLMSAIIENAQLAALEITDGTDVKSMQDLLDSVRISVERSADVLEHLSVEADPPADARPQRLN
jgi:light-regulated signal transduction histidine kinase (bacteriophytochrome)